MNAKTIALIHSLSLGLNDRDLFGLTMMVQFGEGYFTQLFVEESEAIQALKDAKFGDLSSARACFVTSLEPDGRMGASCVVGFAGFVSGWKR